ncbi:hypothetical protein Aduo_000742 [Ancylostoma duodenale]
MSTSSWQSAAENSPMDVEQEVAQDHIEDNVNDQSTMGQVPASQEKAAEVPNLQELLARVSRRKRWQTQEPEVKLRRTVASILSAVFQCVEDRTTFSSPSDVHHVNWHCPGKMTYQRLGMECSATVPLQDMVLKAPFGALTFSHSPLVLSHLFGVLSRSHNPESWQSGTARLLDCIHDGIKPTEFGLAWSFFQQYCTHMTLTTAVEVALVAAEHPPRKSRDFINLGNVADKARQLVKNNPWTNISSKLLIQQKNLIFLPAGFENVVKCLESETQKVLVIREEDMLPELFTEDYSAIVIFSTTESVLATRCCGAWTLLMQAVAKGSELIALAGPQNGENWGRSVDLMRDLFEEKIAQRPTLGSRIRCFLPLRSEQEMQGVGFRALADKTKIPTRRNKNARTSQSSHSRCPYRTNWKGQHHRGRGVPRSHRQAAPQEYLLERPLQLNGNKMFKYVPVGAGCRSKARGLGERLHHEWQWPRQLH